MVTRQETLGSRIQRLRNERGISKSELARRAGVSPTAVHNWEVWGVGPRPQFFEKIAAALGVTRAVMEGAVSEDHISAAGQDRVQAIGEMKKRIAALYGVSTDRVSVYIEL